MYYAQKSEYALPAQTSTVGRSQPSNRSRQASSPIILFQQSHGWSFAPHLSSQPEGCQWCRGRKLLRARPGGSLTFTTRPAFSPQFGYVCEQPFALSPTWFVDLPKYGILRFDYVSTSRPGHHLMHLPARRFQASSRGYGPVGVMCCRRSFLVFRARFSSARRGPIPGRIRSKRSTPARSTTDMVWAAFQRCPRRLGTCAASRPSCSLQGVPKSSLHIYADYH